MVKGVPVKGVEADAEAVNPAKSASDARTLRALGSLMTRSFRQGYNWAFIAALVACAAWLVVAVLGGAGRARRP